MYVCEQYSTPNKKKKIQHYDGNIYTRIRISGAPCVFFHSIIMINNRQVYRDCPHLLHLCKAVLHAARGWRT